jgi:hypothetical protein
METRRMESPWRRLPSPTESPGERTSSIREERKESGLEGDWESNEGAHLKWRRVCLRDWREEIYGLFESLAEDGKGKGERGEKRKSWQSLAGRGARESGGSWRGYCNISTAQRADRETSYASGDTDASTARRQERANAKDLVPAALAPPIQRAFNSLIINHNRVLSPTPTRTCRPGPGHPPPPAASPPTRPPTIAAIPHTAPPRPTPPHAVPPPPQPPPP